jgi:predicted ATP-grasp superfamily ATP-dependent carboligase
MLLPAIKLDTEPLIEEAERIEEQIKSMMMHKLQTSEEDLAPTMTEGASSMLYG